KAICTDKIGSITHQPACGDEFTKLVTRGDRMASRRRNQLIPSAQEKCLAGNQDSVDMLLSEAHERRFDITFATRVKDLKLEPKCACRGLYVPCLRFGGWVRWVEEKTDKGGARHQLAQQFQPLRRECLDQKTYTGDIAVGSAETGNQTKFDGISTG